MNIQNKYNCFALLIIIFISISAFVSKGETISFEYENTSGNLSTTTYIVDSIEYVKFQIDNTSLLGEIGYPAIPVTYLNIEVPVNSKGFSVTNKEIDSHEKIILNKRIYPMQPEHSINTIGNENVFIDLQNRELQSLDSFEPKVVNDFFVNGKHHVVTIALPLLCFDRQSNCISLIKSTHVDINYNVCNHADIGVSPIIGPQSSFDINIKDVIDFSYSESLTDRIRDIENYYESYYIILTLEKYKESLAQLMKWKTQKGYKVKIETIENITNSNKYHNVNDNIAFDKESLLRNWLIYEKERLGTFQLLIVGDYSEQTPIRKFRDITKTASNDEEWMEWYDSENFIPSDAYFSDLTSIFDISSITDGFYYGNIKDNNHYNPDIPVGRLVVNNNNDITNYIDKLLIYEIAPGLGNAEYLNRGMVSRQHQHRNYPSLLNKIDALTDSVILTDIQGLNDFESNKPVGSDVINAMRGCGIISLMGHGSPGSLACSGEGEWRNYRYIQPLDYYRYEQTQHYNYDNDNSFDLLNNHFEPSILYSLSCTVSPFDNFRKKNGEYLNLPYTIGSGFTCGGAYGGVAFIGNTRTGWDASNIRMEQTFGQLINNHMNLGNAVMMSNTISGVSMYSRLTRNLVGDPDISVWLGKPTTPTLLSSIYANQNECYMEFIGDELENSDLVIYDGGHILQSLVYPIQILYILIQARGLNLRTGV